MNFLTSMDMKKLLAFLKQHIDVVLCWAVVLVYLSPFLILGQNIHIRISDNLDSNAVWYKLLAEQGTLFANSHSVIPSIMNGLPQSSLGSIWSVIVLLYKIFPPYAAYVINAFLVHSIAFLGMYALLRRLLPKPQHHLPAAVGMLFALLPFYTIYGLTIAGQPLLYFCFLKIYDHRKFFPYLLYIILFPFYSYFFLSGIFLVAAIFGGLVVAYVHDRKVSWYGMGAFGIFVGTYLFVEQRLILDMLFGNYTPQRVEFALSQSNWLQTYYHFKNNLLYSTYSSASYHSPLIIIAAALYSIIALIKKIRIPRFLLTLCAGIIVLSACTVLPAWLLNESSGTTLPILRSFQLERVQWLQPVLWYLLLAYTLWFTIKYWRYGVVVMWLLIVLQTVHLFRQQDEIKFQSELTYRQYYAESLFSSIKQTINRDPATFRVASIGIDPAVSLYNGLYTIDGYVTIYPLAYKRQFRQVIASELAKNSANQKYFDTWGSKAYILIDELEQKSIETARRDHLELNNLELNWSVLHTLNCQYILSVAQINNAADNHLTLQKKFSDTQLPYDLYLYHVE